MTDETQEQQITAVGNEMSASFLAAKKRSDATLAKLEEHPEKFTMLTGDRPTGRLHLGHYFGSIRERVAMQNRGVNSNIIIADYQVITTATPPSTSRTMCSTWCSTTWPPASTRTRP